MAGSRKTMVYTADNGTKYAVEIDESNGEAFGFDDFTNTNTEGYLPQYFEMRYVNWRSDDGTLNRQFWVGKPDNTFFLNGGRFTVATIGAANAVVTKAGDLTSARGEKRRLPKAADTGLDDGDAT